MKLKITDPHVITLLQQLRSHYGLSRLAYSDIYLEIDDIQVSALAQNISITVTRNKTVVENGNEFLLTIKETFDFVTWIEEGEEAGTFIDKFELRPTGEEEINRTNNGRVTQDLGWMGDAPDLPEDEKPAIVLD